MEIYLRISDEDAEYIIQHILPSYQNTGNPEIQTVQDWLLYKITEDLQASRDLDASFELLHQQAQKEQELRCNCDHTNGTFKELPLEELQKMCTFLGCGCSLDSSVGA
jgi:hypothetical protein